jgi:diadenosine tetraphosphate (Ap4A) HIT family hydrolase/2'-5' RNA ligase
MEFKMAESALIIAVPEAEPLVREWRERFDSSARVGVPAHITILYPFIPPDEITSAVVAELRDFFAACAAFEFTLPELRRFPDVLYLAPSPAEPFTALTHAVVERYPDYPPYGGSFPEVIPHLTIADVDDAEKLANIEREFRQQHGVRLPVKATASEALLIENSSGRWETRHTFQMVKKECVLCRGMAGDAELRRIQVWEDALWRLTISLEAEVLGFAYLEPKRHIPHITDLSGEEARTFGEVLARVTQALQDETDAELIYGYIFGGGVPHLHVHLAPHRPGDALNTQMIRGDVINEVLPSGAERFISKDFPPLPEEEQRAVAQRLQQRLQSAR